MRLLIRTNVTTKDQGVILKTSSGKNLSQNLAQEKLKPNFVLIIKNSYAKRREFLGKS